MRYTWITAAGIGLLAVQAWAGESGPLMSDRDMASYGMGVDIARNLKKQGVDMDLDLLMKGLKDGASGERLLVPEKDLRKFMRSFQAEVRRKMVLNQREAAVENKKKGADFLAANKTKEGVVSLPSGVQYKILREGTGAIPTDASMIECHFRGTLLDGEEFDSSEPGKPVRLMPSGSKWRIFIPPQSAYGERGVGSDIGPNEVLIVEMELVGIK